MSPHASPRPPAGTRRASEAAVLAEITRAPGTIADLAARAGYSVHTVGRDVDMLRSEGLVERGTDGVWRRSVGDG